MRKLLNTLTIVLLSASLAAAQGQSPLHVTVDIPDNPPNDVAFWHGGSLELGDWCWVQVETYDDKGAPEPWVPVTVRVYNESFTLLQYHTTRTGSDGVTRVRIQSAPSDPTGMWTAMANRMVGKRGLGDSITFPTRTRE